MTAEQLVCERDGVATRLRCAGCRAGICPGCLVRTPVGHKCPPCAGEGMPVPPRSRVRLVVGTGAALAAVVGALALLRPTSETPRDAVTVEPAGQAAPATGQAMIGEEVRDGQLVFVVDDLACEAAQGQSGPKLCRLRFTVRNESTSPALFLGRFQYLVDAQSRRYGPDEALTRSVPENGNRSLSEINVNPEVAIPLTFVFELPGSVEPAEAHFRGTGRSRFGINVRLQHRA